MNFYVQVLRTCSMPDLRKLFQTQLPDNVDFMVISSDQNKQTASDRDQQRKTSVTDKSPGSQTAEAEDEADIPKEGAQVKEEPDG